MPQTSSAEPVDRKNGSDASAASAANPGTVLTAAQIDAIQRRMIEEFRKTVDAIEMRKVALEAAVKLCEAAAHPKPSPIELAQMIYDFLMEPAAEIVVRVS